MERPKVFICYAREDNDPAKSPVRWLDRVRQFLSPFEQNDEIEVFHDDDIPVGKEWDELIMRQVAECSVAVLLCSPAFLASKYIRNREMPVLLRRWKAGEILLVPLLLSECLLDDVTYRYPDAKSGPGRIRISEIQLAGRNLEALADLGRGKQDQILKLAAQEVIRHAWSLVKASESAISLAVPTQDVPPPLPAPTRVIPVRLKHPWDNSLGMRFVPIPGIDSWFCIWPTRVQDYRAFAEANPDVDDSWKDPRREGEPVTPGPTHPVVMVNWHEAFAFCAWLTDKERREGRLPEGRAYRLPTDQEWSRAVGLDETLGETRQDREEKTAGVYPWGTQWPPPKGAGNFADETFRKCFGEGWSHIEGYDDGFATTSPVGSFTPSSTGLFDLVGNVWEWCENRYDGKGEKRVLRGGSWNLNDPRALHSPLRILVGPGARNDSCGFRLVLGADGSAR